MNRASVLLAIAAFAANAGAQSVMSGVPAFRAGNWQVYRAVDQMTDKITCTGVYDNNPAIQLADTALYLRFRGGLESVTVRYGDLEALPLRLADRREKGINSVIIDSVVFDHLRTVPRLRLRVSTLLAGIQSADVDMTGFGAALDNILADCPGDLRAPARPRK